MIMKYDSITLNGDEYEVLDRAGHYDYEWDEVALVRRKADGALFIASDAGCSCYDFGDNVDFCPVFSLREGRRKFAEAARGLEPYQY